VSNFDFGQPDGAMCQLAFIVEDLHAAIKRYTREFNAGPWFVMEQVDIRNATYRGQPTSFRGSLASGNSGHLQIELIQQVDDTPSVFTETIKARGYGMHHIGVAVHDFDAWMKKYEAAGYEVALYCETDIPNRNAYLDTRGELPYFVEVIEMNAGTERIFTSVYRPSIGWNGEDPIRSFGTFHAPKM